MKVTLNTLLTLFTHPRVTWLDLVFFRSEADAVMMIGEYDTTHDTVDMLRRTLSEQQRGAVVVSVTILDDYELRVVLGYTEDF